MIACIGPCGTSLRRARPRSLVLCGACAGRAREAFRASVAGLGPTEYQRAWNRFYGNAAVVAATLAAQQEARAS